LAIEIDQRICTDHHRAAVARSHIRSLGACEDARQC